MKPALSKIPVFAAAFMCAALPVTDVHAQAICLEFLDNGVAGGAQPRGIVAAYFNADTLLDVATSNYETDNISICHGNGDATFQPAMDLAVGDAPTDLVAADLDNDGLTDLMTTDQGDDAVSVIMNLGGGTYAPAVPYDCGGFPWRLLADYIDWDGTKDLLTADGNGTISVLIGNGDGTFDPPVSYPAETEPVSLFLTDLNGDLYRDVLYTHLAGLGETEHFFSILWGSGPGQFDTISHVEHPFTQLDAIVGDPNFDGIGDVITADFSDGSVSIILNNGGGVLTYDTTIPASIAPNALQLHDIDLDLVNDLVLSDYGGNAVDVMRGIAGGYEPVVHTVAAVNPEDFAVGRFNADAYPDIVVGSTYSGMAYFGIVINCLPSGIAGEGAGPLRVFPNPADDLLMIQLPGHTANAHATLSDVAGRTVLRALVRTGRDQLQVRDLPDGCYTLRISSPDGSVLTVAQVIIAHR